MKGIVFNLLEEVIRRDRGEEAWDDLLRAAGMDGAFTSLGNYPDAALDDLVRTAAVRYDRSEADMLRWFGRRAMALLAGRYPEFFRRSTSTRGFLTTLNDIIHPEVRKLYPGAYVPVFDFDFDPAASGAIRMGYRSRRRLCHLAEGFIEGTADWYSEEALVSQSRCVRRGDDRCVFDVQLRSAGALS
jgi:hypothetical protein